MSAGGKVVSEQYWPKNRVANAQVESIILQGQQFHHWLIIIQDIPKMPPVGFVTAVGGLLAKFDGAERDSKSKIDEQPPEIDPHQLANGYEMVGANTVFHKSVVSSIVGGLVQVNVAINLQAVFLEGIMDIEQFPDPSQGHQSARIFVI